MPRDSVSSRDRPLHIAMVAPPYYSVPPAGYGGVEAVVAGLVDGLVDLGHEVTLFAAGDHRTRSQEFVRTWELMPTEHLGQALPEVVNAARIHGLLGAAERFDVVHDHTLAGPLLAPGRRVPTVVTVHGPTHDLADVYRPLGSSAHLVAISQAQRRSAPDLNWVGTVHNGIDVDSFPFSADKGDYVVFLGRYHPDKAPHLAIAAARRAGVRIVLAGKCSEPVERDYYAAEIAPLLGDDAEDVGVAEGTAKGELLAGARCMVFPIQWDEPFGMVLAESLACGTPVVALDAGSVPEVVDDGRTGIVVHRPEDLGQAIREVGRLDPADCRREAEERFSTGAMTGGYVRVYDEVLSRTTA